MVEVPNYKRDEKRKEKKCKFPGCQTTFIGTGKSCYCLIHRDKMFRKFIDADKIEEKKKEQHQNNINSNKIIDHQFQNSTIQIHYCELCNAKYEIKIIPGIKIYSRFCPDHRNEYKRKRYIEMKGKQVHEIN